MLVQSLVKLTQGLCRVSTLPRCQMAAFASDAHDVRPLPLRSKKNKSPGNTSEFFVDVRRVRLTGGTGGNGAISFLQLWSNETAGPDGGDGGHGGHVILQACSSVKDLRHLQPVVKAAPGEKGYPQDCCGKNALHSIIKVPVGTVVKDEGGVVVGDLEEEGTLYLAAKGGAGGRGNHFFTSDLIQSPQIAEEGAAGEDRRLLLEVKSMANFGLVGMPNAGKSTLLRAISRARPKVAPYAFTTLKPHIGVVQYSDHEQIAVADLPGLIQDSHLNRGLGVEFLRHAERCSTLLYVLDLSLEAELSAVAQLDMLEREVEGFSEELLARKRLVVGNKMDLEGAEKNLESLQAALNEPVMGISGKTGKNLTQLLHVLREMYDGMKPKE